MERRPLTAIAVCWIVGSGGAYIFQGRAFWLIWLGLSLMCPFFAVIRRLSGSNSVLLWVAFTLGAVYWMYSDARNVSKISQELLATNIETLDGYAVQAEGIITSDIKIDGDRADFTIRLNSMTYTEARKELEGLPETNKKVVGEQVAVQVRLAAAEELDIADIWKRGQQIRLHGTLEQPGEARKF